MVSVAQPLVQASLLGEAIDGGPVAVFVADEEMRYVAVNQFACSLLGYTREELLALMVTDVARAPDVAVRYDEMLSTRFQSGAVTLSRKDGSELGGSYLAQETTIAGMGFYVCVVVPD
jgi:PAS domain S-box-containing protein